MEVAQSLKISLPQGFDAVIEGQTIRIKNAKGEVAKKIPSREITAKKEGNEIVLEAFSKKKKVFAVMNSMEKHLLNSIMGLEKGFEYRLHVVYKHFPINLAVKGNNVEINNFLGEKQPRIARILPGAKVEIKGKEVFVKGFDKDAVGQTAANIESQSKVKGKDRRVFQDGIFLFKKGLEGAE